MRPETREIVDEYIRFNRARRELVTDTKAFATWISASRPELFLLITKKDVNIESGAFDAWFDGLEVAKRNSPPSRTDDFCERHASFCTKLDEVVESHYYSTPTVATITIDSSDNNEQQSDKTIQIAEDASVDIVDALIRNIEVMNGDYSNDDRYAAIVRITELMQQQSKHDTRANDLVYRILSMGQTILSRLNALT
jgi:hypothetical protein